jgi:hypothetical protein
MLVGIAHVKRVPDDEAYVGVGRISHEQRKASCVVVREQSVAYVDEHGYYDVVSELEIITYAEYCVPQNKQIKEIKLATEEKPQPPSETNN